MNPTASAAAGGHAGIIGAIERVIGWLQSVPYSVLALPLRFAVATDELDVTPQLRVFTFEVAPGRVFPVSGRLLCVHGNQSGTSRR